MSYCKHIEPQNRASYEDFVAARNEIALDIGKNEIVIEKKNITSNNFFLGYVKDAPHTTNCVNCDERISQGDLAVIAPKFPDQVGC